MIHSMVFLLSHAPNERLSKRLEVAVTGSDRVEMLYWDRFSDVLHGAVPEGVLSEALVLTWHRDSVLRRTMDTVVLVTRVARWLRKRPEPPRIIYVSGVDMLFPALIYRRLRREVALVWEIADLPGTTYAGSLVDRLLWHLLRRFAASVNLCILTSPSYVLRMAERGVHFNRTLVLENLPRQGYVIDSEPRVPRRSRVMVGCYGQIQDAAGIVMLCDAVHRVRDVSVVIAGAGAGFAKLEEHCRLMPETVLLGSYSYADIASLYRSVDIAYVPYDPRSGNNQAALPNRLYDAVAFGVPVIVPPGTFLAEEVRRHGVGIVLKDDSTDELTSVLDRLTGRYSDELSDLRESVRAYVGSKFWEEERPLLAAELARLLQN
jgi:succinoglycan biosynthesis protein ExoL